MRQKSKITASLLVLTMIISSFFSCNENNDAPEDDTLSFRDQVNLEDEKAVDVQKPILDTYKIIVVCSEDGDESEDFNWFMGDIQDEFQKKGVYVEYINFSEGKTIKIDDKNLTLELDIVKLMETNKISGSTYVFIEKGRKPIGVNYDMSDETIRKAKEYFGMN